MLITYLADDSFSDEINQGNFRKVTPEYEKLLLETETSPTVAIMHDLKEEFHFLFEESKNLGEGTLKLIDWLKKAEPYYEIVFQRLSVGFRR